VANADVTLRLLRYFHVLADELNYRRAAERLFISQPALSAAIRHLEHSIGAPLFNRDTHSVTLTAAGHAWRPHVLKALTEFDAALDAAAMLIDRAPVRIGYLIGTGADLLFRLIDGVEAGTPGLTVETTEYDFNDPTAGLASGASDIALLRPPVSVPDIEMAVVAKETWVACLPRSHPLADRSELTIEELLDEPIIVAPRSAGIWRDYWMAADARDGRPANIAAEAATYEAETTLISRGVGISFTTSSLMRLYDRPGIRFVPIIGRPVSYTTLGWIPARLSPPAERVVRHMLARIPVASEG
jgi:DNA-binding transcriptional LysR family regulator